MRSSSRPLSVLAAVAACMLSTGSLAGPTRDVPTSTRPAPATTAPTFTCQVSAAKPPGPNEFQATDVTVTLRSGSLPANKKVNVRLGSSARGNVLTTVCTTDFGRDRSASDNNVVVSPPITDPNYRWTCNASLTTAACDPQQVPH